MGSYDVLYLFLHVGLRQRFSRSSRVAPIETLEMTELNKGDTPVYVS